MSLTDAQYAGEQQVAMSCTTSEATAFFVKHAESDGRQFALSVNSALFTASSFTNSDENDSSTKTSIRQNAQTTAVSRILCSVHPTVAFRISENQMRLSVEAENSARKVRDKSAGLRFMKDFGSHICSDIHHLGGIFYQIVEMTTEKSSFVREMEEEFNRETSMEGSFKFSHYCIEGGVHIQRKTFNATSDSNGTSKEFCAANFLCSTKSLGPSTSNLDEFNKLVRENQQYWRIIDRGDVSSLIPVWDIIEEHPSADVKKAANYIRLAWVQQAQKMKNIPLIQDELKLALEAISARRPSVRVLAPDDEIAVRDMNAFIENICHSFDINDDSKWQRDLLDIFERISTLRAKSSIDLMVEALRNSNFCGMLEKVACIPDRDKARDFFTS